MTSVFTEIHKHPHPLAGLMVTFTNESSVADPLFASGEDFTVVDWIDRKIFISWKDGVGSNRLAAVFNRRYAGGMKAKYIPKDDEVVIVKNSDGGLYPVHDKELSNSNGSGD